MKYGLMFYDTVALLLKHFVNINFQHLITFNTYYVSSLISSTCEPNQLLLEKRLAVKEYVV